MGSGHIGGDPRCKHNAALTSGRWPDRHHQKGVYRDIRYCSGRQVVHVLTSLAILHPLQPDPCLVRLDLNQYRTNHAPHNRTQPLPLIIT